MNIHTINSGPLEEFYLEPESCVVPLPLWKNQCERMLMLVPFLRDIEGPQAFVLHSHSSLIFKQGPSYKFPNLLVVDVGGQRFKIQYRIPNSKSPWKDSWLSAADQDPHKAAQMIVFGLREATQALAELQGLGLEGPTDEPNDPVVGVRRFLEGDNRRVHLDRDGRQYVLDESYQPIYGTWVVPDENSDPFVTNRSSKN
jgi:hypothetical protein